MDQEGEDREGGAEGGKVVNTTEVIQPKLSSTKQVFEVLVLILIA